MSIGQIHRAWAFILISLCASVSPAASIDAKPFGETMSGAAVTQYTLTNDKGASASVINYGATLTSLKVPDKNGKLGDVVLGFDNVRQYELQSPYFGATIGRVGNRIAHGIFMLGDRRYCVPVNNGLNSLHGGFTGYDKRVWTAQAAMTANGPGVRLTLLDPDGAEGYPGNVKVTLIYSFSNDDTLEIEYFATTDAPTPINLTNHSYFNLKDEGRTPIFDHTLKVFADHYTPVNDELIPTGEIAPVKGTPIDFTETKPMGRDLKSMGKNPIGFDHNLVLNSQTGDMAKAAEITEPSSGRTMEVWTTEPGLQFYSGNFLDGSFKGKGGVTYNQYAAFVLECQHYPDAVNQPKFPSVILTPIQVYRQITLYRFGVTGETH